MAPASSLPSSLNPIHSASKYSGRTPPKYRAAHKKLLTSISMAPGSPSGGLSSRDVTSTTRGPMRRAAAASEAELHARERAAATRGDGEGGGRHSSHHPVLPPDVTTAPPSPPQATAAARRMGPRVVLVTSLLLKPPEGDPGAIEMLVSSFL